METKQFMVKLKLSIFILFVHSIYYSQINPSIPKWVKIIEIKNIPPVNKNQIKDGYNYILLDEQYNTTTFENYFHYATTAITENALLDVSQLEISFDPHYQKAQFHTIKIYRGNTTIDKTKDVKIETLLEENQRNAGIINGRKTYYVNLTDVRKNDIIEYSYSIKGKNPIYENYFNYDLALNYSVPVGKIFYRIIIDKNIKPHIFNHLTSQAPQIITSTTNEYTWEVLSPKIVDLDSKIPDWYNPFAKIQFSNISSWSEVKTHCNKLFSQPEFNSKIMKTTLDSIINIKSDTKTKINAIIDFVQTQIRYSGNESGIYSYIPRTPDVVLKNRFGDCKEKSVLLNEMLKLINVEAYPVLLNTVLGSKIQNFAPSLNAFDHCISVFKYENRNYFIDPTNSYQKGNFTLRQSPTYELGMVLDDSKVEFTKIPIENKSKTEIFEQFNISKNNDATLKVISKYYGANADEMRFYFANNSLFDIQNNYINFYNKYSKKTKVIDTVNFKDDFENNEFTSTEFYLLPNFWTAEIEDPNIILKDFIPYSLNDKLNYGDEIRRKDPMFLQFPCLHTHTISVNNQAGWDIKESHKIEDNKYFEYRYSTIIKNKELILTYYYNSKTNYIDTSNYADYKNKMDFVDKNIVFSVQEKKTNTNVFSFNWMLILFILFGILIGSYCLYYFNKLSIQTPYYNKYSTISSWLVLLGIGICLNPIVLLYSFVSQYYSDLNVNYYIYYFDVESNGFSPLMGYFNLFIAFFNVILLFFSILLVISFFKRKNNFRIYFVSFRFFNIIFLIINVIILNIIYKDTTNTEERLMLSKETTSLIRIIVQAILWVPYIWYSERSKHTFTVGNDNCFNLTEPNKN